MDEKHQFKITPGMQFQIAGLVWAILGSVVAVWLFPESPLWEVMAMIGMTIFGIATVYWFWNELMW